MLLLVLANDVDREDLLLRSIMVRASHVSLWILNPRVSLCPIRTCMNLHVDRYRVALY